MHAEGLSNTLRTQLVADGAILILDNYEYCPREVKVSTQFFFFPFSNMVQEFYNMAAEKESEFFYFLSS